MRRSRSKVPNPTSQISRPGRVFQMSRLSHSSHLFAMFPLFAMFAMFPMFPVFSMFPRTPDAQNETEHQGMRKTRVGGPRVSKGSSSSSECKTFYHPVRRSGVHPSYSRRGAFGIRDPRKSRLETQSRFTRFKCFRRFISFIRFNRFRSAQSRQKMKRRIGIALGSLC